MTDVRFVSIGKDCDPIECDYTKLAPAEFLATMRQEYPIMFRLFEHGLGQKLADARAGMNRKTEGYEPEKARQLSLKVWDNLTNKIWGRERGASSSMSPLEARINRNVSAIIRKAIREAGYGVKDADDEKFDAAKHVTTEKFEELVAGYIADNLETVTKTAEAELAKEAAAPKVNLAALGLK